MANGISNNKSKNQQLIKSSFGDFHGKLLENVLLARYTSWEVGGIARYFYQPRDLDDLTVFLANLEKDIPVLWLGAGTNVLVRDKGFNGCVIHVQNLLDQLSFDQNSSIIRAECGARSSKLCYFALDEGLIGLEFLAGIPGTVGGALAMNAGAYGSSTWDHVVKVETINRQGERFIRLPEAFKIGYREVLMSDQEWFVAGYFSLQPGDKRQALENIKIMLDNRKNKHPLDLPNAGSVFRNPPNDYAARLIESCDLKGFCMGGACVSEKHANFIVNQGNATAKDIEELIYHIQDRVLKRFGIELQCEVKII